MFCHEAGSEAPAGEDISALEFQGLYVFAEQLA